MDNQQEGSLQTLHTGGSGYRRKGHAIHEQADEKAMQREINDLKIWLRAFFIILVPTLLPDGLLRLLL